MEMISHFHSKLIRLFSSMIEHNINELLKIKGTFSKIFKDMYFYNVNERHTIALIMDLSYCS